MTGELPPYAFVVLATSACFFVAGCVGDSPAPATVSRPGATPTALADEPIQSGERVVVTIEDLTGPGEAFVESVRVDPQGRINLPYLRGGARIAGLSEAQAERTIAEAYTGPSQALFRLTVNVRRSPSAGPFP